MLAGDIELVKDLNIVPTTLGSSPREFVQVGSLTYFTAQTTLHGRELWKTDGTAAGTVLVKDIYPGTGNGVGLGPNNEEPVRSLVNVNGVLFFRASNGVGRSSLWKSDGTETGTVQVTTSSGFTPIIDPPGAGQPWWDTVLRHV
jgi:ELWxxDGT repeat protein